MHKLPPQQPPPYFHLLLHYWVWDLNNINTIHHRRPWKIGYRISRAAAAIEIAITDSTKRTGRLIAPRVAALNVMVGAMVKIVTILTTLITGDLSFFYDSNGLWNQYLNGNLKIIIVNNSGGGIFRFIEGPNTVPEFEQFIETAQQYNAEGIAQTFGLNYHAAHNDNELDEGLEALFSSNKKAGILEIFTPRTVNDTLLKNYFNHLKKMILLTSSSGLILTGCNTGSNHFVLRISGGSAVMKSLSWISSLKSSGISMPNK